VRETETALQQFAECVLKHRLARHTAAPYVVRRVRQFLARQAAQRPRVDSEAVRNFLAHLAVHRQVSASTQNQALAAVVYLCREVLGTEVEGPATTACAKGSGRLPVVLSVPETAALPEAMRGTARLTASLIYGGGLRVYECCELRIKDIDLGQGLVTVRAGKGAKDRTTLLPDSCRAELEAQLGRCRRTRSGAPSRPACGSTASTSARSRSTSATRTWKPR